MRGPISIALSGAIGLTTEAYAAIKYRHEDKALAEHEEYLEDKDEWMLQEVQEHIRGGATKNTSKLEVTALTPSTVPGLRHDVRLQCLEYPVIIPQRRPRTRSRGFLRAYAPSLNGSQIEEAMFMSFLQGFDDAIKVRKLNRPYTNQSH